MKLSIKAFGIDNAMSEMAKIDTKIDRAQRKAIKRTISIISKKILQQVSKETAIAQKYYKQYGRLKTKTQRKNGTLTSQFWFGSNVMPAHTAKGRSVQEDWGVRRGKYLFKSTFLARVYGNKPLIWFRKKSRGAKYNPATNKRWKNKKNDSSSPLMMAGINVDPAAKKALKQLSPKLIADFEKRVKKQIQWELNR